MKATFAIAAAAALVGGVSAKTVYHRHAHDIFHGLEKKGVDNGTCIAACTTIYSTYYGEAIVHTHKPTAAPTSVAAVVPTPIAQTCPTTGVYTFPATTLTLTKTVTVVAASSTALPSSGTYTIGGVTTTVATPTTVVCPYATTSTSAGVTSNVLKTTSYVCPSAGTYTIAPITVTVTKATTVVYPVVSTYVPGTYTASEVVTTVTETSTVVYCPFTSSTTAPVYPTAAVYPTGSAVATYSSTPKPTGHLTGNGKAPWAVTYTPYDESGHCKSASAVDSDIAAIAKTGISAVRVYSTDCSTLPNVGGAAAKYGVKLILGIFINAPNPAYCNANYPGIADQINDIKLWARWDLVDLIVIGNEAIFNNYCKAGDLATLIKVCKSEFSGYTGPYTTADTVSVWQEPEVSSALCDVVDIVGCQAHAFFNTETVASQAGEFVKGQLAIVNSICPGKVGKVMETGWPSAGKCLGKACPGVYEQSQAIASLLAEVSQDAVFFSLTDDPWKSADTECACEQHWGCGSLLGA